MSRSTVQIKWDDNNNIAKISEKNLPTFEIISKDYYVLMGFALRQNTWRIEVVIHSSLLYPYLDNDYEIYLYIYTPPPPLITTSYCFGNNDCNLRGKFDR